jgi:formylglycine-generating enzyme required for sulfatase activity
VLVTNLPGEIDLFSNGDTLQATGPLCSTVAEKTNGPPVTISIKKTGELSTRMSRPRFQYVIVGDILPEITTPPQRKPSVEVLQDCEFCPQMLRLPGATFAMGSAASPTEQPVHQVTVPPFIITRYPITIAQWRQCAVAMACSYEPIRDGSSDDQPVHNVSWDDAQQYVSWISGLTKQNYRLPTEAEWEYAARAGSNTAYWWGDRLADRMANCRECGEPFEVDAPVAPARFAANPLGLYGTAGGVAQWVLDCWHESYAGAPSDGSSWDGADCSEHVLRGGSWMDNASKLRSASRGHYGGSLRYPTHGFRIARAP